MTCHSSDIGGPTSSKTRLAARFLRVKEQEHRALLFEIEQLRHEVQAARDAAESGERSL